jgi:hypothetical protein
MTSLFVASQSSRLMPYLLGERERERRLPPDGTPLPWKNSIIYAYINILVHIAV